MLYTDRRKLNKLVESLADTISDYRPNEIKKPMVEHVTQWISQFEKDAQIPILQELSYVLRRTYYSKERILNVLTSFLGSPELVGDLPKTFWESANFLRLQIPGQSQCDLLDLFDRVLQETYSIKLSSCGSKSGPYIYLDDFLLTGQSIADHVGSWIRGGAPSRATLYILLLALHKYGWSCIKKRIEDAIRATKKQITIYWVSDLEFENRPEFLNVSDVLRPASLPDLKLVQDYYMRIQRESHPPTLRRFANIDVKRSFGSKEGRDILERHLLIAGLKIRSLFKHPPPHLRPLGLAPQSFGFGALTVTYRNCPNHCPVALWWGDVTGESDYLWNQWYPLLPRSREDQINDIFYLGTVIRNNPSAWW